MIGILLAACLLAPSYLDLAPPVVCDPGAGACRCTDVEWDAVPGATRYEIDRLGDWSGIVTHAGTVSETCDEEGACTVPNSFSMFRDPLVPNEGIPYRYRVRACNAEGCSAWSPWVRNSGFPTACIDGEEYPCYTGAPLRIR